MSHGICHLTVIPVRAENSDKAEMVTQLIFGEHYAVNEETEKWAYITIEHDGYQGWICKKQLFEVDYQEFDELSINDFPICSQNQVQVHTKRGDVFLSKGCVLPYYKGDVVKLRSESLSVETEIAGLDLADLRSHSESFLGVPYLWGGRTSYGIDCSGLTQILYRLCGSSIARDAHQQAEVGEPVHFLDEAEDGDLAFFDNQEGRITHVGIVFKHEDGFTIIHASGLVREDKLDHQGIYRSDTSEYSHNLRTIRRVV